MTDERVKESIAPCGLCCETCFAHVDGDIRRYSLKLKEKLGNFHINAKRFETLLDNPIFNKYPAFKEMLDYFDPGIPDQVERARRYRVPQVLAPFTYRLSVGGTESSEFKVTLRTPPLIDADPLVLV